MRLETILNERDERSMLDVLFKENEQLESVRLFALWVPVFLFITLFHTLKVLPAEQFADEKRDPSLNNHEAACAICLQAFAPEDLQSCSNQQSSCEFCGDCVERWLAQDAERNNRCPICRNFPLDSQRYVELRNHLRPLQHALQTRYILFLDRQRGMPLRSVFAFDSALTALDADYMADRVLQHFQESGRRLVEVSPDLNEVVTEMIDIQARLNIAENMLASDSRRRFVVGLIEDLREDAFWILANTLVQRVHADRSDPSSWLFPFHLLGASVLIQTSCTLSFLSGLMLLFLTL